MNYNIDGNGSSSDTASPASESSRKRKSNSWGLAVLQKDKEILQEMGVGILSHGSSEDENEQPIPKKRCNDENVSPNVNCASSSHTKSPKKSPDHSTKASKSEKKSTSLKHSPSPGPSRVKSPDESAASSRQLCEWEMMNFRYLDEETPLQQYSITEPYYMMSRNVLGSSTNAADSIYTEPLDTELSEEVLLNLRSQFQPEGADAFSVLSDEVMLNIFKWLCKHTLSLCMLVCKRWHRIACDETFWQRLEFGNRRIKNGAIGKIFARKPIIIRFANSGIGHWTNTTGLDEPSRIQYLDLSACTISLETLNSIMEKCPHLKKLSLELVKINNRTCRLLGRCSKMEALNLTMAPGLTHIGLQYILQGCQSMLSLNLSWCNLDINSLNVLSTDVNRKLQRLNISGAKCLTDELLSAIVSRCPQLLELDASDCTKISDISCIYKLNLLEHLGLSRCYLLTPSVFTQLKCMPSLRYLEIFSMLQTPSLVAMSKALPGIKINQFVYSAIARPTVGVRRTSIWGLRTRDSD